MATASNSSRAPTGGTVKLRLSGIGTMRARGEARTPGQVVCADILRKADGWILSLVVACEPHRERMGEQVAGLDWGVETFATLCHGPHDFVEIPNDRLLAQEQDAIKAAQRGLSRHLRGRRSKRVARVKRLLSKRSRRLANRRKDRNHQTTARLVRDHAVIITEDLSVVNMTASAKGTAEAPGKKVAAEGWAEPGDPGYRTRRMAVSADEESGRSWRSGHLGRFTQAQAIADRSG